MTEFQVKGVYASTLACTFPDDFLQEARNIARWRTVAVPTAQRFRLVLVVRQHRR
jgi:hypothetical protein